MKKRIKKIFLPKWQRYFIVPLLVGTWLFTGYTEFFSAEAGEMGITGFTFMTVVLLGVSLMVWFMTSGRLPAYTMEEEIEEAEVNNTK